MRYPMTRRIDHVDDLHGTVVADPYRWLEDPDAPDTRAWVDAQRAVTDAWLADATDRDGTRDEIRERLTQLWDHPKRGAPWRRGDRWFQFRNTGLQAQHVLWTMPAADAEGQVLLDPNTWTTDGTAALTGVAISDDGRWIAYARSERGSDWQTWRVRRVGDATDRPHVVEWSKFSGAAWAPDGSGFWYGAYDPPSEGATYRARTDGQRLCFHRVGQPQSADEVVCAWPDQPEWAFSPWVSHDGRWLVVTVWKGTDPRRRIHVADLQGDGVVRPLLDDFDAEYRVIGVDGDRLLVLTDHDAPTRRVVAVPLGTGPPPRPWSDGRRDDDVAFDGGDGLHGPMRPWTQVVAPTDDAVDDVRLVGGRLVVVRLRDASHRVTVHTLDGRLDHELALGELCAVAELAGRADDEVVHLVRTSWTRPADVLGHRLDGRRTAVVFAPGLPDGDADLRASQVFVDSTDGVAVPMSLVHRADVDPTTAGTPARALLYGYGGFGISVLPAFNVAWRVWVERGGVLAVANLRGGGEYGQRWHDAGRLANKPQVFDDAVACAEWLVGRGWTTADRLAVQGGSNGGLLAAACITRRPDAFGAAVIQVGVLDMLRFHRFTIGWAWTSDYGDPGDPDDFAVLHAYSPLHQLHPGTRYPATLLVTGDHDDRVVPAHSFKFAAALQAAQAGDAPVLLRVETSAGHGVGTPTHKLIAQRADILAFCEAVLPPGPSSGTSRAAGARVKETTT